MNNLKERISDLPPTYTALVAGDMPARVAAEVAAELGFTAAQAKVLREAVIFTMLFYFQKPELEQYLKNELKVSEQFAYDVAKLLIQLLPEEFPRHVYEERAVDSTTASQEPSESIAATALQNSRTMSADMQQAEPTHQSSQETLLNQPTPFDQPRPGGRWESETE